MIIIIIVMTSVPICNRCLCKLLFKGRI